MSVPGPTPPGRHPQDAAVVDPAVAPRNRPRRSEWSGHRTVLPVIALGGMVGAAARHAAGLAWPRSTDQVPWATLGVNVTGCLLIGVLMVFVVEVGGTHALLRPFIGIGVLGGFTTFSTYAVEADALVDAGRPLLALGYVLGTVLAALLAVSVGVWAGRGGVRAQRWLAARRGAET